MFFSSLLPYSTTSRPTTRTTFRAVTQDNLRVPITVHFVFTASFLHVSFLFHLSSRALKQCLPTPRHYHAAVVRSLICPFLVFPFYAYISYSITITGTPRGRRYDTKLRHRRQASTHVYKIALLLVEEGIESNRLIFPSFLSSLLSRVLSPPLGDRLVEPMSTRSWLITCVSSYLSRHTHSLSLPFSLFLLDDSFALAARTLDTIGKQNSAHPSSGGPGHSLGKLVKCLEISEEGVAPTRWR